MMAQAATSDSLFLLSRIFLHSRVLVSLSGGMSYLRFRITEVVAGMRMMFMIYPPAGGSRAAVFQVADGHIVHFLARCSGLTRTLGNNLCKEPVCAGRAASENTRPCQQRSLKTAWREN